VVIELVNIVAPRGKTQELGKALASLVGPIQVQPGCVSCRLSQPWQIREGLQIEARWNTQQDLVLHLRSDIYKQLLLLVELSSSPPTLEFFAVHEIYGLDLVEKVRGADHRMGGN
jgi:quinol monooxygenase YgiN